jgi:hypothetical protein
LTAPTRPSFAPWDEREWPRLLSKDEGTRRVAAFAAVERRQAALCDEWASTVTESHLQTILRRHARHAAWHAHLWESAMSDSAPADDRDVVELLDKVADAKGAEQTIELLTGLYRVLVPRKVTAYTYYQRAIGTEDTEADWRWIELMLRDELDAVRDGELAIQTLLASPSSSGAGGVERSAARKAELEASIVRTGGLVGPDTLGMATEATKANKADKEAKAT